MSRTPKRRAPGATPPRGTRPTPAAEGEIVAIDTLLEDDSNARRHPERNRQAIRQSLTEVGAARSIVLNGARKVLAGNGVLAEAKAAGFTHVRLVPSDGTTLVAVVRANLTPDQETRLALFDNRTGELAEWEPAVLAALHEQGVSLAGLWTDDEFEALLAIDTPAVPDPPRSHPDHAPALRRTDIRPGHIFDLGRHTLACGNGGSPELAASLLDGKKALLAMSDPPYCSGGFQEAGRSAGTWGDIAADNLSSRGFTALIRGVLEAWRPQTAYFFTDWRMWIALHDIVEAQGLAARSMIVWDKGTPGLGSLWRPQHELVLFASRETNKRAKGRAAKANVIAGMPALGSAEREAQDAQAAIVNGKRTGNKLHYTEKPVSVLERLLEGDEAHPRGRCDVVDFFAGSGTTLMAAEARGRRCIAVEVEPKFCQVIIDRFEATTSQKAVRR